MKQKGIIGIIIRCILGLIGIAIMVLLIGREQFFRDDSYFYTLFDEASKLTSVQLLVRSVIIILMSWDLCFYKIHNEYPNHQESKGKNTM